MTASLFLILRLLIDRQVILRGPKIGPVGSYHLNPHYGWKARSRTCAKPVRRASNSLRPLNREQDADASGDPS